MWRDSPYIDISHAASILHHDEYSLSYIASILKTPSTIIDVGAHTGWFSLLSKIVFPEARVIGIEPLHTNIQFLQYNALKNNLEIECIEKAIIGKADKIVNGCMTRNSPGHTTLWLDEYQHDPGEHEPLIRFPSSTFSDFWDANQIDSCDILKLDCEGAETYILQQSMDILKDIKIIVGEYHPNIWGIEREKIEKKNINMKDFLISSLKDTHNISIPNGHSLLSIDEGHPDFGNFIAIRKDLV